LIGSSCVSIKYLIVDELPKNGVPNVDVNIIRIGGKGDIKIRSNCVKSHIASNTEVMDALHQPEIVGFVIKSVDIAGTLARCNDLNSRDRDIFDNDEEKADMMSNTSVRER
jgi:hypothetical protein